MRQEVMPAKFQPHASQMHFKWAEIRYRTQYAVYSNKPSKPIIKKGRTSMIISGLLKTTLLDYPGCVAATVFLGGCNMRCPFCHNSSLIEHPKEAYSTEEFFTFLQKRKNILEGICISGGEPTLHPDLPEFIKSIKDYGFPVKLDTNGSNPSMLHHLIEAKLIDYVAMDVKSAPSHYDWCCGTTVDITDISKSVNLLKEGHIPYEFRTTVVSQLHSTDTIKELGAFLQGADKLFLQNFVASAEVQDKTLRPLPKGTLEEYINLLKHYVPNTFIRGE